jgi:hypothetical protein
MSKIFYTRNTLPKYKNYTELEKVRSSGCKAIYFWEILTFRRNFVTSSSVSYMPLALAGFLLCLSFDVKYGGYIFLRNVRLSPNCRYYNTEDRTSHIHPRGNLNCNWRIMGRSVTISYRVKFVGWGETESTRYFGYQLAYYTIPVW